MLVEPRLSDSLRRSGQPSFDDRDAQFLVIESGQLRHADEHRWVAVEVRRREEDAAIRRACAFVSRCTDRRLAIQAGAFTWASELRMSRRALTSSRR
jgi:hypothetical protein